LPLQSLPSPAEEGFVARGNALLFEGHGYVKNLARARLGNLLFVGIAMMVVVAWGRRFSDAVGLLALAFLGSLPPILGHAGVVTTDMAVAATLPLALLVFDAFLANPRWQRTLLLGGALGLGMLSKYSFLVFFPICAIVLLILRRRFPFARMIVAGVIALLIVWVGYRFDVGPMVKSHQFADAWLNGAHLRALGDIRVPAPLFWLGIVMLKAHNAGGHYAYLLGRYSDHGWWYYFPVIFFFKTPIPFMILAAWGGALLVRARRGLEFVLFPAAIMASVLTSSINIGIRHILPIYPPLCVVAAYGAVELWKSRRAVAAVLAAWMFVGVAIAHPDYLAWFNETAGRHPERIAVDSNLDWGQDVLRLARVCRERHIDRIAVLLTGGFDYARMGIPAEPLPLGGRMKGWIAVGETSLKLAHEWGGDFAWLDAYPYERVGKGVRLYRIP
jgi:4-amino-4-deoxy-L-arabinose transferase-like glycosyltransferase